MTWCGWRSKENCHILVNQFHGNFRSKTLSCRIIRSVIRDVKWCFNASWGLKGLNDDKTEMVIFCPKHHLGQYGHCTINIWDSAIIPVNCTGCPPLSDRWCHQERSLGADYPSFGLLQLIAPEPTRSQIARLQRIQNKAAWLVTRTFMWGHRC